MRKILFFSIVIIFCINVFAMKKNPKPYAFPNPYNILENKKLKVFVPFHKNSLITVDVYSQKGKFIKRICKKKLFKSSNFCEWDGKDDEKSIVESGLYFIHIIRERNKIINKKVFKLAVY